MQIVGGGLSVGRGLWEEGECMGAMLDYVTLAIRKETEEDGK